MVAEQHVPEPVATPPADEDVETYVLIKHVVLLLATVGGVLGVLPGVIGSLQGTEALKLVLGIGEPLVGRLLLFDALGASFTEVAVRRDPACPVCGDEPTITEYVDYVEFCGGAR